MSAEVLTLRDEQGGLTLDHFRYEDERSEIVPGSVFCPSQTDVRKDRYPLASISCQAGSVDAAR